MSELAPPLSWCEVRACLLEQLVVSHRRMQLEMLVFRQQVVEFEQMQTLSDRKFVPDELSLVLGQSPQSMRNLFIDAQETCALPICARP